MIFYFSGTGNSQWAAKTLALQTQDELYSIAKIIKTDCTFRLKKGEQVGFVFPVHGWRVPRIVRVFLQKLKLTDEEAQPLKHHCFCLMTAGDTIAKAMERFQQHLYETPIGGMLELDLVGSVIMPESYVGLPGMDVDTKEKELEKKQAAEIYLRDFGKKIIQKQKEDDYQPCGWKELTVGPLPWFFSVPVGGFFERFLITDKPFHVDHQRCVKCGICANVCPVADIKGGLGYEPEWLHNKKCLTCFACYHHCPHHAIEYGKRTVKKGQYFYNRYKVKENI